ncbi:hypothetical protein QUF72_23445 [Desulfobacterales bacterium HSG2]|nr:hypothetical protein [Desulfobacterales bacterium HSG2]
MKTHSERIKQIKLVTCQACDWTGFNTDMDHIGENNQITADLCCPYCGYNHIKDTPVKRDCN